LKKTWLIFNTVVVLILTVFLFCSSAYAASPKVILDKKVLSFDVPPVFEKGRIMVPMRAIFEAIGATVSWNNSTQTAVADREGTEVQIKIGSSTAVKMALKSS